MSARDNGEVLAGQDPDKAGQTGPDADGYPKLRISPWGLHAHRCDVNDAAKTSRNHSVNDRTDQKYWRKHIGIDRADSVLARHLPKVARRWPTRVVNENIWVRTGRQYGLSTLFCRDVASNWNNFDACFLMDLLRRRLKSVLVPRIDNEIHALTGERDGDCAPESL